MQLSLLLQRLCPDPNPLRDSPQSSPAYACRLLPFSAKKCIEGAFNTFCLPHLHGKYGRALRVHWLLLGLNEKALPVPPPPMTLMQNDTLDLTSIVAQQSADFIRSYVSSLNSSADPEEYRKGEKCVAVMQAMVDQLNPLAFLKTLKDLRGHTRLSHVTAAVSRIASYRVPTLLKVCMFGRPVVKRCQFVGRDQGCL